MSCAIRNDLKGWRAVGCKEDCAADEHYSEFPPVAAIPDPQDEINARALVYLAETDWYVIRKQETGEAIPPDVLDKRQAARKAVVR